MDPPTIHTKLWDAVIAIPVIIIITYSTFKSIFACPVKYVLLIDLVIALLISSSIVFMGWFYGYAANGNQVALKTTIISFKNIKKTE